MTEAVATLARAKAQLASDEDAQSSAVSAAATSSSGGGKQTQKPRSSKPSTPSTPSKPDPALQQALAELASRAEGRDRRPVGRLGGDHRGEAGAVRADPGLPGR